MIDSPIKRFMEAANDVIAEGMAAISRDNPTGYTAAMEFAKAGAFPRIVADTHPEASTVDLVLVGADGGQMRVFEFTLKRVQPGRH